MTNRLKQRPVLGSLIETIWYVGFTDRDGPVKWWDIFTRKGFRHVYLYSGAGDVIIVMTMTRGGLLVTSFNTKDLPKGQNAHQYLKDLYGGQVVVPARGLISSGVQIPRRAPFTCVELARSVLGLDVMIYTPWQLFRYLTANRLAGELL